MSRVDQDIQAVKNLLQSCSCVAVAVSGGIDSLTLATLAGRELGSRAAMYHAVSAAVPAEATQRVQSLAKSEGWVLQIVDAGEFARQDYVSNPVNRCFHCKQSLYATIAAAASSIEQILSGTNMDDLGEYRPGLQAARLAGVRHPFVEARIDKVGIRRIAQDLGLGRLATLPASPCLSSRVETGIAISPDLLTFIHAAETALQRLLGLGTVRCRYRSTGIVVELSSVDLAALSLRQKEMVVESTRAVFDQTEFSAPVSLATYRAGSAFLVKANGQRRAA